MDGSWISLKIWSALKFSFLALSGKTGVLFVLADRENEPLSPQPPKTLIAVTVFSKDLLLI